MKGRKMIRVRTPLSLIVAGMSLYLILCAAPAQAHHAFAAEFDAKKPVTLHGTVSKLVWINPHAWIYVDLKKSDGTVEQWGIEAAGPNALKSRGLTTDFLKPGTEIIINGYQSRDGSLRANGRDLAIPGGQPLFIGSAGTPYDDASLPHDDPGTIVGPDGQRTIGVQLSGAWWMNTLVMQRLGITDDQKAKIERTFENHRQAILSTTKQLENEEAQLARLLDAESVDRNAVFTQIDRVTQARSEMERAGALMTLEMREYLTRDQWERLPRTNVSIGTTIVRPPAVRQPPVPGKRGGQ
jgi:Spy/CpxP family protein refolding chaperone